MGKGTTRLRATVVEWCRMKLLLFTNLSLERTLRCDEARSARMSWGFDELLDARISGTGVQTYPSVDKEYG